MAEEADLDAFLREVGSFGRCQQLLLLLLAFPAIFSGIGSMAYVFTASEVTYRCRIPECEDVADKAWLQWALPAGSSDCYRYTNNDTDSCSKEGFLNVTEHCNSWVYPDGESSIQSEWDVTCEGSEWKLSLIGLLNSAGQLFGMSIIGALTDRFGRKKMLVITLVMSAVVGSCKAFSNSFTLFAVLEFVNLAIGGSMIFGTTFVLALELVGADRRDLGAVTISALESTGVLILGLISWGLRRWRLILLAYNVPAFLFVGYYWLLPESVRWLLTKGRTGRAEGILRRVARINNAGFSEQNLTAILQTRQVSPNEVSVWRKLMGSKVLIVRFVVCSYCWITCTLVYYGLSLNSTSLGSDKYTSFLAVSAVELPSYALTYLIIRSRLGRRLGMVATLLLSGLCCFAFVGIPEDMEMVSLCVYLLGKLSITVAFTGVYILTAEVFPTEVRTSLLGGCSMFGRLGSLVAPLTPPLAQYWTSLPLLIFGTVGVSAGLLSLLLPETKDTKLPDTVHQSEVIGTKPLSVNREHQSK